MTDEPQDDDFDLKLRAAFARREDPLEDPPSALRFDGKAVAEAARAFARNRRIAGTRFDILWRPTRTAAAGLILGVVFAMLAIGVLRSRFASAPPPVPSETVAVASPRYGELREVLRTRNGELTVVRRTIAAPRRLGDRP